MRACVLSAQCPYLRVSVLSSYYILDRRTAPSDRTVPKFFARMCGYIVSPQKKNLTHPTPGGGFRGLYIVKNLSRRIPPKFGTHVRIDTLTLKKKLTHPTPGGFRGLYIVKNLSRRIAPKFGTHVQIDTLTLKKN